MTIINRELVGEGTPSDPNLQHPHLPLGIYLETVIQKNIANYGDGKWITDVSTGKSMSYSQLMSSLRSVASALRKRGLKTGDNVVLIGCNDIELPLMSMAVWRAGGTQACLSVNLPRDAIEARIEEIGSKFVLTDYARAGRIVEVAKRLDFVRNVFLIGNEAVAGCTQFDELLKDAGDECPENLDDIDPNSAAWLAYTSGTTGTAKCLVLSHRTVVGWLLPYRMASKTKILFVNNMNNTGGLSTAIGSTTCHFELYCISNFSEENLLSAIDSVKPPAVNMFPAHIAWVCKYPHLKQYDLSSVKIVSVVGSLLNPKYEREIFYKLPNLLVLNNVYGMSEVGLVCRQRLPTMAEMVGLDKSKAITRHVFGSVGTVHMFCKLKVINPDTGDKLGPNQVGEICVQTPFMLTGYLNKPEETANFLREGWAHTGDKGYYDENEQVFIVGRYKELIKFRNLNILPSNIESNIVSHPAVEDAAVVGLPHDEDGERPLAFVVLSERKEVSTDELMVYVNDKVMDEEKLRGGLRFIEKIPRNELGKIIRPELMKLL
ncbi:4-coumarate--CoA ligase 3 isoform X2 [Daphnia magna]|uniref:4-coumarate--CoA ligase 3 isoform X2 n=1 Tax=Daphnia magna TaxID=35525 RepID=UPI001E1BB388|nr:4-coumarate--CoA ligase 3 isoform X2 [Daphnia magna]